MKLSIVIPVYNEKNTISKILEKIENVDLDTIEKEIVIIDDCSTDGTRDILKGLAVDKYKIFYHEKNQGKGYTDYCALGNGEDDCNCGGNRESLDFGKKVLGSKGRERTRFRGN